MNPPQPLISELDVVDEASRESFPASDAPAWGSAHATTEPMPEETTIARNRRLKQIAIAVGALAALVGLALTWRMMRAS